MYQFSFTKISKYENNIVLNVPTPLWLCSMRLIGQLGEFYYTLWIGIAQKLLRGAVIHGDQNQRRRGDRRAELRKSRPKEKRELVEAC